MILRGGAGIHRCGITIPGHFVPANRAAASKAHTTPLVLPLPTEPASLGFGVDPWLVTGERRPWIAVGASAPYGYRVPLAGKGGWV